MKQSERFRILTRDNFTCRYCGRSAPNVLLQVDHVHPQSRGGSDTEDNLVTACKDCNIGKMARLLPLGERSSRRGPEMLPHVDRCGKCRGSRLYAALGESPRRQGYVAVYRCELGHEWDTFWSDESRLSQSQINDLLLEEACG